jgi:hypothetical protein
VKKIKKLKRRLKMFDFKCSSHVPLDVYAIYSLTHEELKDLFVLCVLKKMTYKEAMILLRACYHPGEWIDTSIPFEKGNRLFDKYCSKYTSAYPYEEPPEGKLLYEFYPQGRPPAIRGFFEYDENPEDYTTLIRFVKLPKR